MMKTLSLLATYCLVIGLALFSPGDLLAQNPSLAQHYYQNGEYSKAAAIYQELVEKTTWPSWKDLWSSSVVVAIASVIIALIIFGMDKVISTVLELVYDIFR